VLSAVPILSRAEALADLTGIARLDCSNDGDSVHDPSLQDINTHVSAAISFSLNTSITNRINFGPGTTITDAVLVVGENEPAAPTVISTLGGPDGRFPVPQLGELETATSFRWPDVLFPVPGAPLNTASPPATCDYTPGTATCHPPSVTLEIKNIRTNNAAFGIPLEPVLPSSPVTGSITIFALAGIAVLPDNQVTIGLPFRGVISSSSPGVGPGDMNVDIEEGFATAFKPLGVPDLDAVAQFGEKGYGVPGSLDATQGTRIIVDFVDETPAAGTTITVPDDLFALDLKLLRVAGHDSDGAGGAVVLGGSTFVLDMSSGVGRVVYEVTQSGPFIAQSTTLQASVVPPTPEDIRVSVMLGPTSTVTSTHETAPVPRFGEIILPISVVSDGVISDGGTVNDDDTDASVTFPSPTGGVGSTVTIDQVDAPFATPPPAGFTSVGTGFVNITINPPVPTPPGFCPTGLTVVLPVSPPLPAGTVLPLLKVNPGTGILEVVNNCGGVPLEGSVDPGGATATFPGVPSLSLIVGLLEEGTLLGIQLLTEVEGLVTNGDLRKGLDAPLKAFLNKALREIQKGKTDLAIKFLEKFQGRVAFLVSQGALDATTGQGLIDAAEDVIQGL